MKKRRVCVTESALLNTRWKNKMLIGAAQKIRMWLVFMRRKIIIRSVFYLCAGENFWAVNHFAPVKMKMDPAEIISSCLTQFYDGSAIIPDEIIIPCHLPDEEVIIEWLTDKET